MVVFERGHSAVLTPHSGTVMTFGALSRVGGGPFPGRRYIVKATAGAGRAARRECDAGHGNEGCPRVLFRTRGPVIGGAHDDHYSAAWREPGPGWPGCLLLGRFAIRSQRAAIPARPRCEAPSGDGAG